MTETEMFIVKTVVYIVVAILSILITTFVIPYLKQKIGNDRYNMISEYVERAVYCAEQLYIGSGLGEVKKDFVLEKMSNIIGNIGYNITDSELDILIESAVKAMNDSTKMIKE